MPKSPFLLLTCAAFLFLCSCKKDKDDPQPTPTPTPPAVAVTDIDGTIYSTVTIGGQVWMAENLRTTKYRDGSTIPEVTDNAAWAGLSTGAWCNYGNYAGNNATYGKLYNWHAVNDSRGLCPQGWHVPSDAEWKTLETTLGMPASELNIAGYRGDAQNVGGKLKAVDQLWEPPNTGATNSSGFSGLPGGHRNADGQFVGSVTMVIGGAPHRLTPPMLGAGTWTTRTLGSIGWAILTRRTGSVCGACGTEPRVFRNSIARASGDYRPGEIR